MGILGEAAQIQRNLKHLTQKQMKRNNILDRLKELNVTHSRDGEEIHKLADKDLVRVLAIEELLRVDITHESNKFF